MKKSIPVCLFTLLLTIPTTLQAQDIGIGARIGTLGFGAEAAVSLNENIAIRGGIGSFVVDFDGEYDDINYTVTPPSLTGTLGIDLYPTGGSFRVMGGLMYRSEDIRLDSEDLANAGSVEIGDVTYTEAGFLHGELDTRSTSPFVGIGFGRHTSGGFGVTLDLGVAFVGDADVIMTASGPIASEPGLQAELDKEALNIEDEAGGYLKYWPILSFGLKIPLNIGG